MQSLASVKLLVYYHVHVQCMSLIDGHQKFIVSPLVLILAQIKRRTCAPLIAASFVYTIVIKRIP